jgi:hypothetical protein
MSFAEGIQGAGLDLADPSIALSVLVAVIAVCVLLDTPAIARTLRLLRRMRQAAKRSRRKLPARGVPGVTSGG